MNIFLTLPSLTSNDQANSKSKEDFIEKALLRAMNELKTEGCDLAKALRFIITEARSPTSSMGFTKEHKVYAKKLLVISELCKDKFQVHSKGLGAICLRKEGIPKSTFIKEYYG
jgi:hypothetical protein